MMIPQLDETKPVRVCENCFVMTDDNTNPMPAPMEVPRTATPITIQSGGCRQSNGTPNGSFNSPGGQKVKG